MTAAELRNAMADRLRAWGGGVIPAQVEAAMRSVPREAFLPGTPLADTYGRSPIVTHRDVHGVATSSASAPGIVAAMLAQLDVRPGHRILEIGAGTGYNAALLACLTGPAGQVTTVELDSVVAAEAQNALATAGWGQVTVIVGDGEYGYAPGAPYDRIIVTAGAWDLPTAWAEQLAPDGLLVAPLRLRGLTRSIAFEHTSGIWRSLSMHECGFMPMRGAGGVPERNIPLGDTGITIRIDDGQPAHATALQRALGSDPAKTWTGIEVTATGELDFWLAGSHGIFGFSQDPRPSRAQDWSRPRSTGEPWGCSPLTASPTSSADPGSQATGSSAPAPTDPDVTSSPPPTPTASTYSTETVRAPVASESKSTRPRTPRFLAPS
jgi:protein-L-isoaspartate(D-aspartate) O-methyltransferase